MRSYHGKRLPNQGEAQMGVPTLGINMYNSDSEVGENYLSSAINAYAHKNECVVLDPGAVYDPSIDMLFPALDITGEALTADIVLDGDTTYLVMLRRNTDGTLSILSLDVHNKTVVHNVSVASTWADPSSDFVCYSTIARTPADIKVVFSSPEYNDIIFYDFTSTPETHTLVFKPKKMVTHLNRLFAIDTSMALWWSGAGQYTNWYSDVFPDNYILEDAGVAPIATESLLSDLIVFNNNLYIFAPNNIYIFRGTDYTSFNIELLLTNFGVSPNHDYKRVYSTKGYLYFVYRDAIYEFNGDSYPTIISRPVAVAGQIANGIGGGIPRLPQGTFFDGSLWADDSRLFFHLGREYYQFDIQERTWWRSAGFALGNEFSGTNDVRQLFFYNFTTNRTDCVVSSIDGANSKLAAFKRLYMDINTAHLETKAFNSMPSHDHTLTNIIIEYKTHIDNEEEYIQIWTADDFYGVRDNLDGNYIIMDDIDIEDWSGWKDFPDYPDWDFEYNWPDPSLWPPFDTSEDPFTGIFISNGFIINGWRTTYDLGSVVYGYTTVYSPFFFKDGDGTPEHPYQVWTATDLYNVRNNLTASYIQMDNIDLSEYGNWSPIGDSEFPFKGQYDGNNYGISNMTIYGNNNDALFGATEDATLKNIYMYFSYVETGNVSGSLVGFMALDRQDGVLDNCHVIDGYIQALSEDYGEDEKIGGLVGYVRNYSGRSISVINCSFSGALDVDGPEVGGIIGFSQATNTYMQYCSCNKVYEYDSVSGTEYVGGLIGKSLGLIIEECSSIIDIKTTHNIIHHTSKASGFCGASDSGTLSIKNSYYSGTVSIEESSPGDSSDKFGTIASYQSMAIIENCFSVALLSLNSETKLYHPISSFPLTTTSNTYYNSDIYNEYDTDEFPTPEDAAMNGVPKTTAQMKSQATYSGWDFSSVWGIDPALNNGYPYLLWEVL